MSKPSHYFTEFYKWSADYDLGEYEHLRSHIEQNALDNAGDIDDYEESLSCAKGTLRIMLDCPDEYELEKLTGESK